MPATINGYVKPTSPTIASKHIPSQTYTRLTPGDYPSELREDNLHSLLSREAAQALRQVTRGTDWSND
jgi:hypothetical protein